MRNFKLSYGLMSGCGMGLMLWQPSCLRAAETKQVVQAVSLEAKPQIVPTVAASAPAFLVGVVDQSILLEKTQQLQMLKQREKMSVQRLEQKIEEIQERMQKINEQAENTPYSPYSQQYKRQNEQLGREMEQLHLQQNEIFGQKEICKEETLQSVHQMVSLWIKTVVDQNSEQKPDMVLFSGLGLYGQKGLVAYANFDSPIVKDYTQAVVEHATQLWAAGDNLEGLKALEEGEEA